MTNSKKGPDRVREALSEAGIEADVQELPDSTRTASEAAQAVGCEVGQIAKSLVFQGKESEKPYLVIASGSNRVDERKLAMLIGEELKLADPEFVREHSGYSIGGVPPLGHTKEFQSFMDEDLLSYDQIWAAAGSPRAVFPVDPKKIVDVTGTQVANVRAHG
ncbi:MAG: YbaK/EbsC family protein [Anaerolineales bacterium]|nr:YbaK/EbsC family protein [Anaerolineales bacterium]